MPRRLVIAAVLLCSLAAYATIFGSVRGLIHDPHHRPVQNAQVAIRSTTSDWKQSTTTDDAGEFHFDNVPARRIQSHCRYPRLRRRRTKANSHLRPRRSPAFLLTASPLTKETVEVTDSGRRRESRIVHHH